MPRMTVYECPECKDRKLLRHSQQLAPTLWCDCGEFVKMEIDNDE